MDAPPQLPSAPLPPPPPTHSEDDNLWIVFSHISPLLGVGIIVPLIAYLVKKDENPTVTHHAKEALNFQISTLIYSFVCAITCVGAPLIFFIVIGGIVLSIIAAVRANDPVPYRYPLTLRLIT